MSIILSRLSGAAPENSISLAYIVPSLAWGQREPTPLGSLGSRAGLDHPCGECDDRPPPGGRGRFKMRRLFILVGLCGALLTALVLPASGVAAKIVAHFHESFTEVEPFVANQVSGTEEPIDNGDGTVTFVATVKGLPEKLKIPHGPTLSRDAGIVTQTTTFLVNPDGSLTFVSSSFSNEKGPHPDLESDFELFCQVVIRALT